MPFYIDNKKISRGELIKMLISRGQVKKYHKAPKRFRKEIRRDELPEMYATASGTLYAVVA